MQKARRHPTKGLRPLVGAWFQGLFHSSVRGSFHLSLTVLFAIGLSVVFSLSGWSPIIQTGFLVSRPTQVSPGMDLRDGTGPSPSAARRSRRFPSLHPSLMDDPITPARALRHRRFGLFPVRSPLLGESFLLSSPAGTKMFQVPAFASRSQRDVGIAPDGLPHSDIRRSKGICPSLRLFAACHVLLRLREPRHPPCALIKLRFSLTDPLFIHMSRLFITFASYIGDGARLLYSFFVSLATARCIFPEPRFHDVIVLSFR